MKRLRILESGKESQLVYHAGRDRVGYRMLANCQQNA